MKKLFLAALSVFMILALAGCGDSGGNNGSVFVTTDIFSDPVFDGDIQRDPVTGAIIITQGMSQTVQSVFAGIDPFTGVESRAFLNFPLTGLGGVPGNAIIDSAFLDIFIDQPLTGTIPLRVDLISFQPPNVVGSNFDRTLRPPDFDLQPLESITVSPTIGFNGQVTIDVTSLMDVAQLTRQLDFQIRILGLVVPVLIEINDTTGADRNSFAPLLTVTYF